ncbi:MAG TPA: hypothetical protein VKP88_07830 [Candidatus Paceibacterota bacterium]|nr:hypothetical protein [Candidatus Paceibacterota bacterium]
MKKDFFNYVRARSLTDVIVFYAAYLVGSVILALILGIIVGIASPNNITAAERGAQYGLILSLVVSLSLTCALILAKKMLGSKKQIALAGGLIVLTLVLASFSVALGLLPGAILTMRSRPGSNLSSSNAVAAAAMAAQPPKSI